MTTNVIVTGFYSSGSSAITDFFKDFKDAIVCDTDEIRFLQDPFGISDLEYNLVDNPHRHNSSQSLKSFLRAVDKLQPKNDKKGPYYIMFNGQFRKLSYDYINSLINFSFYGYNHNDINSLPPFNLFLYKIRRKIVVLFTKNVRYNFFPKLVDFCAWPTKVDFLDKTNQYLNLLSNAANPSKKKVVVFDQLFPTSNLDRYVRYFTSAKTIVVNRDPRDLYLNCINKIHDHVIPTDDIYKYCDWYENTRKQNAHGNSDSILEINFEDFVLNFEQTSSSICSFLGIPFNLKNHICKHFDPNVSKNNVNQMLKTANKSEEIKIIEERLKKYLYNF